MVKKKIVIRPDDPLSPVVHTCAEEVAVEPTLWSSDSDIEEDTAKAALSSAAQRAMAPLPPASPALPAPVPTNQRFVSRARAALPISQMPARADAITKLGLDPDDPDAKVPEPSACRGRHLVAYSYALYEPGHPPHPAFDRFDEYEGWLLALEYRSAAWVEEHDKFCTGSLIGAILGLNPGKTPEKAWVECRFPSAVREESAYVQNILERGVQLETLHEHLFAAVDRTHVLVCGCGSQLHRKFKWLMGTPDAKVYEVDAATGARGRHVRDCEFKTPWSRGAFFVVPPEYMAQIQITMEVDDIGACDFSTLRVDDKSGRSEWIVIRVKRSRKYWQAARRVIMPFCRAVLTGARPPPRGTFKSPVIKTETLVRVADVLDLLPNWRAKLSTAIVSARRKSAETAEQNRQANVLLSQKQLEADQAAQAALDAAFNVT